MSVLVICPSRGRPELLVRMIESLKSTASGYVDIVAGLDDDDPLLSKYLDIDVERVICSGLTVTQIINKIYHSYPGYSFYSVSNDDFYYHTPGWDAKLAVNNKISYPNDMSGGKLPTTSVICAEVAEALGWMQMPLLTHLYGDVVWKYVGEKLNILNYRADVVVEHNHFLMGKEDKSLYAKSNSREMYARDQEAFREWISTTAKEDIDRARLVLSGVR